ncbi:hypothetical protein DWB61_08670 [Ancylomarina euxinus]|uniref:Uncharacterized protein n=1 Tax=Ancylomarina euxinus TaxID=2283627 RepID=A0A425Y1L2_9BACT|nr:DUF5715 family protein [Ancylomarina euxinus]MCZ4695141.1 DUF5715 family protein [Ancylomarina euxinus]MUP14925.1 hypothetical protein [Ancylomarina euxinus]RRG21819.1 hypothetical protein DWB61_08670 [Ancylomarina euxinus]
MDKRKKRYSIRKILMAAVLFAVSVFLIIRVLNPTPKGKNINKFSVSVLTKAEKGALRRYNNDYHLEVARTKGLKEPLDSRKDDKESAEAFCDRHELVEITDNEYYEIPRLSNSLPYLQESAEEFLNLLGERFCNQLEELGLKKYRFSISSILRTLEDQKSLRKSNVNATPNSSSHYYGRTFDIVQTRYFERGNSTPVYTYRLRNILLRELIKLQDEGKCYVLLERQTKCIHVTVR